MSAKLKKKHRFWKMGFVLFLSSLVVSASLYWSTPVSADLVIDPRRADMLAIAEMYANYQWTAAETNLLQLPYPHGRFTDYYPDNDYEQEKLEKLLEPGSSTWKVFDNFNGSSGDLNR